jgi:hypothetical protein
MRDAPLSWCVKDEGLLDAASRRIPELSDLRAIVATAANQHWIYLTDCWGRLPAHSARGRIF